ncbi:MULTISPECIES: tetratricopeptide repeat protein [unclassified Microcystis]|uniref:Tetratricopeptide repeat protein n=1 Tax=Microcystis flos-aquae Mf_QC_C_20070823_S10D TaxID=2486236 RepID=A0A552KV74_9CHRO|nr:MULTISPECIES: tetratricopeptide repeat protein [unclassified Microcystis]MCA2817060.1 tetratricopeptide repeat protein [Microcystis sp. M085S1]MCA2853372.1 tetratricopeptide repeat protein [Microcystis sp. M065S1]TRT93924.1 MAG: tetratricopeptide repeat protein [Microcystis flos-aquae Ma_QC_C_20070823_S18D]TRV11863.1 MAG: tetratricopeptide repeat protein [Microcystis flos-aquae Mf_QC_C_20070823_S10D]TRV24565.1 MAG: tetratricopeptide repeat protein [Microcystis flos-aquae Mf_QC_C_20070823_S1
MNPKFYALLTLSLVATVTLPVVNGKLSSLVPAVIAQNTDARKAEADQLLQLCRQNLDNNQVKLAIQSCQQAVIAYRQIKDLSGEAKSTANLGNAYVNDGQYRQAISVLENAVKIAQESKERRVEALAFLYLGGAYYELGEFKESIEFFQQTLIIAKEIKDADLEKSAEKLLVLMEAEKQRKEADKLFEQGAQQYEISQFREALQSWEKALQIYQEIKNRQGEAASLDNLGSAYLSLGQYQKAIDLHEKSLVINREIVNRQGEANSLNNLGNAYQSRGEYQTAIDYHQQSLDIRREIKDRQGEAASLNNLGNAYQSRGEYQTAINYHQQSLAITRELDDRSGEAKALNNLGVDYRLLGQYQKAINYHQQSLEIAEKIGDLKVQADSLGNLGNVYQSLGQYQKAIDYHQQSLEIAEKIGDQGSKARSLGNLGNAYQSRGEYQKAIDLYEKSLVITRDIGLRQEEGSFLNNLGVAHYFLGEYEKAIDYLKQTLDIAKKIGDLKGEADSLGNLGSAYLSLGQYQKAINYHQENRAIARKIGDLQGEANSLNNLGVAYQKINQPAEAIKNLEESLNIILKIRGDISRENIAGQNRKSFLASNEKTVITLATILIQQNQPEKAFQWLNLATTADLADYNRLINAKVADTDAQKALDNWNADNQQLEGMRRQLQDKYSEELAQQIRQFEEKVYKNAETIGDKYPEIAELFESKPTDIAQLQKNIAPDTLVIQPVPLRDEVALFLVTREKLIVIQSDAKRDELNKLVSEYRTQLADYKNADYLVTGSKLYEILIRPIESQIATSSPKNIAIIATGQLRYIPFETLYDKKNDQVLLEKYPIYYLTRISTSTPPATERKPLQGLAFANPKPTQEELKGTEIEAETISKIFPGSEKYLGTNATLDIFKKQAFRFSILHLGTHGCFDLAGCPNLGMQANTILFANNQQYNIADAALLGLKNTELITLSACQTAKEANADGQEISGLAYVLERAGAKSVIASLWNAEDNTSAEIMTQFYQNLKNGMSKSEAMRQAKLSQIKSHPFFWSPFILIGAANYEEGRF